MREQTAAADETVWVPLMGLTRTELLEAHPILGCPCLWDTSCQKWQLGRREGLCAIEAKPPTHTGLVSHRHWPAIPRAGPGTGLLPQAPWATCWGGTCHIAPPASPAPGPAPTDGPGFLPAFEVQVQLSGVCGVCRGRSSLPTSTWPHSSPVCLPTGCGPRARGSRKEAEQAGPVPLPEQGRARTTAEQAAGPGTGQAGCWQACHLDRILLGCPLSRWEP